MDIIPNKRYFAIIQGLSDQTDGKYKLHIPELMAHDLNFRWCMGMNRVSKYAKWMDPDSKKVYSMGWYLPLQVGMNVEVIFDTTSYQSCKIVDLYYTESPMNKDDQESYYLWGKTKNGTQIYTDDSRNLTHIMHNNGLTNCIMMDDKITLSVNEVSAVGSNTFSVVEVGKESITLKVGETSIVLDASGIHYGVKGNSYTYGGKEFNIKTEKFSVESDTTEILSRQIFLTGTEEIHSKGTVNRVTGGQHLSLNGNVVNVESTINTTIQSATSLNLSANVNLDINCESNVSISTYGYLYMSGTSTVLDGINTTINGTTLALNAPIIYEDSQIMRGMGIASAVAPANVGSAMAISTSLGIMDTSLTTAFHFNDPFSGMASNMITEASIPGVAQGTPNPMPLVNMVPSFDYISSVLKYTHSNNEISNIGTIDTFNGLRGNSFPSVYLKKDENV